MTETIIGWIISFVSSYPEFSMVLMAVGFLRVLVKPIRTVIETYVAATPSLEDDKKVNEFFNSKAWQLFMYVIEVLTSIKVKK